MILRALRIGIATFMVLVFGLTLAVMDTNQAKAWPFTSGEHIGFFTGNNDPYGTFVIAEGITSTTGTSLITQIGNALNLTGRFSAPQDDGGAAFIILTMLGCRENGCGVTGMADAIATAKSRFNEWANLVRQYEDAGRIRNINYTYIRNTYAQDAAPRDIAWYTPAGGAQTDPAIVFTNASGGVIYAIKKECGNPVGNVNPLPDISWSLTGNSSVSSATATPGQTVTFTHRITNTGDATATGWSWRIYMMPPTPGVSAETPRTANAAGAALAGGAGRNYTNAYTIPGTANAGDRYCQRVGFDPVNNNTPPGRNGRSNTICVTVRGWELSATSAVSASGARPGTAVTFTHVVRNDGNMTVPAGAWNWRLYWEPPTASPPGGGAHTPVGGACSPTSGAGNALAPSGTRTVTCNYTLPASAANGARYCMSIGYTPANNNVPPLTNQYSTAACVQAHAQIVVTCSLTAPSSLEEGTNVPITVTIAQTAATSFFPVANPRNLSYTISGPSGFSQSGSSSAMTANTTVNSAAAGSYSVRVTFSGGPPGGLDSVPSTTFNPCGSFTVSRMPYFRVYSGDAAAGAGFTTAGACGSPPANSRITAFNKGGGSYEGSGSQIGAIAQDAIAEFVSASFGTTSPLPRGLSFANSGGGVGTYGGSFAGSLCIPDYWSLRTVTGAPVTHVGNYPVAGHTLNTNVKEDVFVQGNAYINGSILYSGSGSWNIATIPYFRLIVYGGNIYISNSVTELNGLYVAIPNGASGGAIYTCASGPSVPSEAFVAASCTNKLTVYGAFIANTVKLLRSTDTLNDATTGTDNRQPDGSAASNTNRASEVFVYTPEVWMGQPMTNPPSTTTFDALTTLPPLL